MAAEEQREMVPTGAFSLSTSEKVIQEQVGELLDIKSFSRKFPDLSRRKIEMEERDFLITIHKIQTIMSETRMF